MGEALVINDKRHGALEVAPAMTPMQELQARIIREGDIDKMKQLMELERQWKADVAKQAFIEAMAAFKSEPEVVRIVKDKVNAQYKQPGNHGSPYASLGKEAATIVPLLSKHGFSGKWALAQNEKGITISYVLTHQGGHTDDPVTVTLPPDTSGSKNLAQQIKSSITYGRIITLECACGIVPIDSIASLDDDGNGIRPADIPQGEMEEPVFLEFLAGIEGAGDKAQLNDAYFAARDAAEKAHDIKAAKSFKDAANKRLAQLKGGR